MMKKLLKKGLLLTFALCAFAANAQKYTFSSGLEGWDLAYGAAGSNSGTVTHSATEGLNGDGALVLARESNNSNFGLNPAGIAASTKKFIRVRFKNATKATQFRIQGAQAADNSDPKITSTIFNITANSTEYVTMYLDMSTVIGWDNTVDNLDILIKANYESGEGSFYLDEIEFLDSAPDNTYSEFILNPSFEGPTGTSHLTGDKDFAVRDLTSTHKHDGDLSFRTTYTADAESTLWAFSSYEKTYTSKFPVDSDIQVKMWVKSSRTSVISMSTRVKLTNGGVDITTKPIATVTTTNTSGDWEELTFNLKNEEEFDGITLWFSLNYMDGEATNLVNGDVVYIDQMTASISAATAGVKDNLLEGTAAYPNPVSDILNVKSPIGSKVSLFNILGAKVRSAINNSDKLELSVSDLPRGVYLLKINSENKLKVSKVILK
ncbi:T9SS type A sorting domain-containing protein [Polaribacter sp. Z014]|uniref:T9SS type A sorting domain-containing protein n=1 Tax=Polaribacter sp. Z014 TaxID=2927126 RepID=UPI0020219AF6|nr:T9SS type A sorting domain-containing protein [Polaribacter sp. Z014]MCL7762998.1 T9SS type A sorting domain-containing protein [Polaribacter sp. Z014]